MAKDNWNKFIKKLLSRKRSNRQYSIPRDYIEALSDRIFSTNPTREILTNTLVDFFKVAFAHGYERKCSERRLFKDRQAKLIRDSWNKEKDAIDDLIYNKNNK